MTPEEILALLQLIAQQQQLINALKQALVEKENDAQDG